MYNNNTLLTDTLFAVGFAFVAFPAAAQDFLCLTVEDLNSPARVFCLDDLDALEQSNFDTTTIWTEGVQSFSGVALHTVLEQAGVTGDDIELIALNDYSIQMPMEEVGEVFPIVATRINGETMSVRNKGPYWVVYPYDSFASFKSDTTYARSIWQLNKIVVSE